MRQYDDIAHELDKNLCYNKVKNVGYLCIYNNELDELVYKLSADAQMIDSKGNPYLDATLCYLFNT